MVLQAEKKEKDKLEKQLIGYYERLTANYERLTGDLRQISSQVTGLENALSLKEREFNDCTEVLKEAIRSRDEQLVKQQKNNMELLKKRETDLKEKHSTKLSEAKKEFESKLDEYESKLFIMEKEYKANLSRMKEEYEAKILATTENYEEQLSISREECEIRVAEVMEELTLKSRQALENAIVSKNEILSSFQSLPIASIPSYKAQNEMIQAHYLSQRGNMKKGDRWYLVDVEWFRQWKKYTGFDSWDQDSAGQASAHPGPIFNGTLFIGNVSETLKDHLIEEQHYALLPELAWNLLLSWYGLSVGSRPIIRTVVEYGSCTKHLNVEVYLIDLQLYLHPNTNNIKRHSFSRADAVSCIMTVIKEQFNIPDTTECRLWQHYMSGNYELLTDVEQAISDAGIYGSQVS
uniref:DUSP domain-containing protein n=1 Tax=Amphimedon queenslandica TaxID=400682 RepID=A0A1X7UAM8_AMPQE